MNYQAYSVPVVEALLQPLQPLFLSKTYNGFNYRYKWDPEPTTNSNNATETAEVGDQPSKDTGLASSMEPENFIFDDSTPDNLDLHYANDSLPPILSKPASIIAITSCAGAIRSSGEMEQENAPVARLERNTKVARSNDEVIRTCDPDLDVTFDSKPPAKASWKDTGPAAAKTFKSKMESTNTKKQESASLSNVEIIDVDSLENETKQITTLKREAPITVASSNNNGNPKNANKEQANNNEATASSLDLMDQKPLQLPTTRGAPSISEVTMQQIMSFDPFSDEFINGFDI
jgi:hypothetical protein